MGLIKVGNLVSDESLLTLKCSKSFLFEMLPVDRFPAAPWSSARIGSWGLLLKMAALLYTSICCKMTFSKLSDKIKLYNVLTTDRIATVTFLFAYLSALILIQDLALALAGLELSL